MQTSGNTWMIFTKNRVTNLQGFLIIKHGLRIITLIIINSTNTIQAIGDSGIIFTKNGLTNLQGLLIIRQGLGIIALR